MIMLFSGRFDRPHLGHIVTIKKLMQRYDEVIVVMLEYVGQHYPTKDRCQILRDGLRYVPGNFNLIVNKEHFAFITRKELSRLPEFDIYGSGNEDCLVHIAALGHDTEYVERYGEFSASHEWKYQKIERIVCD